MTPAILVCAVTLMLSALLCGVMVWLGPRDAPDGERKTQARPVPSAGGAAILLTVVIVAAVLNLGNWPSTLQYLVGSGAVPHLVLVLGAAIVGFIDDAKGMPARVKLAALAGLSVYAASAGFHVEEMRLPGFAEPVAIPPLIGVVGTALWLFVVINAVNFMDGANGLAMGSLALMLLPVAFLFAMAGLYGAPDMLAASLLLIVIGAIIGFLIWNMTGRLYAGDTGALSLGALFASASVYAVGPDVWIAAIIALPFLVDVLLTLVWRYRAGRHLMHAHRDHAYQLFLRAGWHHWQVALLWWTLTLMCSLILIVSAYLFNNNAIEGIVSFAVALVIGCALWCWQRATLGRRLAAEGR